MDDRTKYISDYINENFFFVKELEDYNIKISICKKLAEMLKSINIYSGNYDFFINSYVDKTMKMMKSKSYERFINVKKHVNLVVENNDALLVVFSSEKNKTFITKIILFNFNYEDIMAGKADDKIVSLVTSASQMRQELHAVDEEYVKIVDGNKYQHGIRKNSVESNDKSLNKMKLKSSKGALSVGQKAAILAVTISVIVASTYMAEKIEESAERSPIEILSEFDDYLYPTIVESSGNQFSDTFSYVIDKYSEYDSYGDVYGQLCLHNVYESCKTEPFYAMDSMLKMIVYAAQNDAVETSLDGKLDGCYSYVSYIYDKLLKANVNDVLDSNITKAINNYNKQVCNYKCLNPYSLLDKKDQNSLKNLMKIYDKYCEELSIQLAKQIEESSVGKGK